MKLKKLLCAGLLSTLAITSTVSLAGCGKSDEEVKDQYNFYMTVSTNPTMFATMGVYAQSTAKNYINFARVGTLTQDSLPLGSYIVETDVAANNENKMDVLKMGKKIKDAYAANNDAEFNFYVDDLNTQFFFDAVVANNIPLSQVTLNLVSDGSGTYSNFQNEMGAKTDAEAKAYYDHCVLSYQKLFDAYDEGDTFIGYLNGDRANATSYTFDGVSYRGIYASTMMNMAIATTNKGFDVNYYVQFPTAFSTLYNVNDFPLLNGIFTASKLKGFNLTTMYKSLPVTSQTAILNGALNATFVADPRLGYYIDNEGNKMVDGISTSETHTNLNTNAWTKTELDQFFTIPTGKQGILVIMGTNAAEVDSGATTANEAKLTDYGQKISKIYEMYGDDYKIINKPHPSKVYSAGTIAMFEEYDITVLPGRFASQFILWCYGDMVKTCGYTGSTFYDANPDSVEFFIDTPSGLLATLFSEYLDNDTENKDIPSLTEKYAEWSANQQ